MPTFSVTACFEDTYQNLYLPQTQGLSQLSGNSKTGVAPRGKRGHRCLQGWRGSTFTSQVTGWWQGQAPLSAWWPSDRARCQFQSKVNPAIQSPSQDYLHHGSDGAPGQRIHLWGTRVMPVRAVKACWHTPGPWERTSEFCKFLCKAFRLMAKAASHFFRVFTEAFYTDCIADGFLWENTTITQTKKCVRYFALNWFSQFSYNTWLSFLPL